MEENLWLGGRYISVNWDMQGVNVRQREIRGSVVLKMRIVVEAINEDEK
jgi:hypothetical protein